MRITKWVDFGGNEVDIDIDMNDVRAAMSEAFSRVATDPLGEELPTRRDVINAFNVIAKFFDALLDEQIQDLTIAQRAIINAFLLKTAERFTTGEKS